MSTEASAVWLMTKDSEMTLSFIADAYGRCLGLFVLLLLAPALLTFVGGKLLRRRSMHYKPPWMCPAWASESDAYILLTSLLAHGAGTQIGEIITVLS